MKINVTYNGTYLIPCYNSDYDNLQKAKLKADQVYQLEIKTPRNYVFHKKYFALINMCFENQEHFELFEDLRDYLTVKSGFFRKIEMPNGYEQIKPKSISFANMDNIEFEELYQKTIDVIIKFLGITERDIHENLINFM